MPDPTNIYREVSLSTRLFWLGAALWVVAAKALVVVAWTPVEVVSSRVRLLLYVAALGLPCVPLVVVAVRSAFSGRWRRGLIASTVLGILLTGMTASGITSAALRATHSWETQQVLYRHRDEPNRTIEHQQRRDGTERQHRIVQTRPITSYLSYTERTSEDKPGPGWVVAAPPEP